MRGSTLVPLILLCAAGLGGSQAIAQGKAACELISRADVEAIVGARLMPPESRAPFRSLLEDQDFTNGPPDSYCEFSNVDPKNLPARRVFVPLEVRYSAEPDRKAVVKTLKQIDERTNDTATMIPGLGDAAFRIGGPANPTLFVFKAGTMRLMIGPSEIGLDREIALARKILGTTSVTSVGGAHAARNPFAQPPMATGGSRIAQLKIKLAPYARQGDAHAQLALAKLYRYGGVNGDGASQPDWAGAGYWYAEASNRGEAEATYALASMYRDGSGVAANAQSALDLFRKAAEAGYVPAMAPLSMAYAAAHTGVSQSRATYWADQADQHGDPHGSYILGYEHSRGWLGGDPPYYYARAMELYRKAADHGVCVAFDGISGLYGDGHGVPRDADAAARWRARGNDCRAQQAGPLWDRTATLAAMSNATGLHGEQPPKRPVIDGGELSTAQGQFLLYVGTALGLMAAAEAAADVLPPDPNEPYVDLGTAMHEMNEQNAMQERERDYLHQLTAPTPPL